MGLHKNNLDSPQGKPFFFNIMKMSQEKKGLFKAKIHSELGLSSSVYLLVGGETLKKRMSTSLQECWALWG